MPVPHHSVFTGWMPFLPPNQQRQSTETTTTTVLRFVCDYRIEPVPTRRNTHPPTILTIIQSLSASSIYHEP